MIARYLAIEAVQKPTDDPSSLALYMGGRARVWTSCNRDEIYGAMMAQAGGDTGAASSALSPASNGQATGGNTNALLLVGVAVGFFLLGAATMRVAINIQTMNRQSRR